jgi:hypothetical protein
MNVTLWIAAGLLAAVAMTGGITKTLVSKEKLAGIKGAEWTRHAGAGFIKTIGVVELLAAVGLILPAVVDIAPFMVPVTAVCWILLMVGAVTVHLRLRQFSLVMVNLSYVALAAFIAWGRFDLEPFTG